MGWTGFCCAVMIVPEWPLLFWERWILYTDPYFEFWDSYSSIAFFSISFYDHFFSIFHYSPQEQHVTRPTKYWKFRRTTLASFGPISHTRCIWQVRRRTSPTIWPFCCCLLIYAEQKKKEFFALKTAGPINCDQLHTIVIQVLAKLSSTWSSERTTVAHTSS